MFQKNKKKHKTELKIKRIPDELYNKAPLSVLLVSVKNVSTLEIKDKEKKTNVFKINFTNNTNILSQKVQTIIKM